MTTGSSGAHFIGPTTGGTGSGFEGDHNDLPGRSAAATHPDTSITSDTTGFTNSDGTTVHEVLADLDAAIVAITPPENAAYSTDVGNGSDNVITVTHNLSTIDVGAFVRDQDGNAILVDWEADTENTVTFTFEGDPPTVDEYRVTIFADGDIDGPGTLALDDLSDVTAPAPTDGQVLTWDSGTSRWVNETPAAGYSDEQVRDVIGAALTAGAGITVTVNDGSDTITIAASGGTKRAEIIVTDPNGVAISTGDGKMYFLVPSAWNGLNLTEVAAAVTTSSSSGTPTVQLARVRSGTPADMLSTKLTIDANETTSYTAATAAVIDTANDDLQTGDFIRVDVDVAGTGAKGLIVVLGAA